MTALITVRAPSDHAQPVLDELASAGYSAGPDATRRRDRYAARRLLWRESALPRLKHCGRTRVDEAGVSIRVRTEADGRRRAGFAGVQSCGSVWACAVCSAKVLARRQQEVFDALEVWHGRGHRVVAATFTMRHHKHHRLATLWDGLADAWHATTSGRQWVVDQRHYGTELDRRITAGAHVGQVVTEHRIPTIRAVEITHGRHGWHVHVHALLLVREGMLDSDVSALLDSMYGRWSRSLVRSGLPRPTRAHGVEGHLLVGDASAATLAQYLAKASYAGSAELTRSDSKQARRGNRTPFAVLADVVATGDADDLDLWHEYERASQGRRQIAWSLQLKEQLGLTAEVSDQEIVDEDFGGEEVQRLVGEDGARLYRFLCWSGADALVLEAAEVSDDCLVRALRRCWDRAQSWGVPHPRRQ